MMILFNDITSKDTYLGGKAQVLGLLTQQGFNVPPGCVLTALPEKEQEWQDLFKWWMSLNEPPLAIRSSAAQEDSKDHSFAGQNKTFLNVSSEKEIKEAIKKCFESIDATASKSYREYFLKNDKNAGMNVVLQKMVAPSKSGVFFSQDPRGIKKESWLIEVIDGLGEDLVSGKETPHQYSQIDQGDESYLSYALINEIAQVGIKVKNFLGYEVDMEFCLDHKNELFILQARPITTLHSKNLDEDYIINELKRLKKLNPIRTTWDGHTFSEWTGNPGFLTFSLWQEAFSPHYSFGDALEKLGYLSFKDEDFSPHTSILESVFGHAYINLNKLAPLFFGPIPYRIVATPRTHLKFDYRKLNMVTVLRTPYSVFKMLKVGWYLSTSRKKIINTCQKELATFKDKMNRPIEPSLYRNWSVEELVERFLKEHESFSRHALYWPFILIILTESSMSSLNALLKSIIGEKQAQEKLKKWLALGIHTTTAEMNRYFKKACAYPEKRPFFMSRYGHRGAGELDLSKPRWVELGEKAFYQLEPEQYDVYKERQKSNKNLVYDEIQKLDSFKRSIVLDEWKLLKEMLELRERWKMELLRPYSHIRFLALEIAKRFDLGDDIFWLDKNEIQKLHLENYSLQLQKKVDRRRKEARAFKKVHLPDVLPLEELDAIISGEHKEILSKTSFKGEPLSPGVVQGRIKIINDIEGIDLEDLEPDTIIFAHATDPGWTPVFTKIKGIIVEKGGVLSHCAILAREMDIPAISGININHDYLKDGLKIWLDGTHGTIRAVN
ncbi:MAG: PEP/pyruvate-binding domain-containing protein [Bacteriovoracaceae bacterium]|jgi:phosphohistidine swiveling domain-containing protein|nr:PEP/pyruvate-binding domain-containing protein [Bacteriovoracaceae bacterium]